MPAISSMVEMLEQEIFYNLSLPTFRRIMHLLESVKLLSYLAGLGKMKSGLQFLHSVAKILKTDASFFARKQFCRAVKN